MEIDASYITQIIRQRRSIFPKNYSGNRVSDEIIQEMLENANWAPTHKMTEPWRFSVFCDEGIEKFVDIHTQVSIASSGKTPDTTKLKNKLSKCSHIISIGMKRNKSIPKMEEIAAVASAVQNMQLTATAHGIGCYWSTGGLTYNKAANEYFDLGKKDKLMGFLYIGIPKEGTSPKGKRKSIDKKVNWIKG